MALIVEDGTGKPNADSYISLEEFEAYVVRMGYDTDEEIVSAAPTRREAMLRRGFIFIDGTYEARLTGQRMSETQAGAFPRLECFYLDGRPVPEGTVPIEWKNAQAEAAILGLQGTPLTVERAQGGRVRREKVDVIETEWFEEPADDTPVFGWIDTILASLVYPMPDENEIGFARIARA
jgi:hypothetical protein